MEKVLVDSGVVLRTLRPIAAGEELLFRYSELCAGEVWAVRLRGEHEGCGGGVRWADDGVAWPGHGADHSAAGVQPLSGGVAGRQGRLFCARRRRACCWRCGPSRSGSCWWRTCSWQAGPPSALVRDWRTQPSPSACCFCAGSACSSCRSWSRRMPSSLLGESEDGVQQIGMGKAVPRERPGCVTCRIASPSAAGQRPAPRHGSPGSPTSATREVDRHDARRLGGGVLQLARRRSPSRCRESEQSSVRRSAPCTCTHRAPSALAGSSLPSATSRAWFSMRI